LRRIISSNEKSIKRVNEGQMVKLIETNNVRLGRKITGFSDETQADFIEIPAIGDENCAGNAAGLLIIDLILRDQFDQVHFDKLKQAIIATSSTLEQRVALYRGQPSPLSGNAYTDLAQPLEEFIDFFCREDHDWNEFAAYIKSRTTREQIAAMHIGLQPALRSLGIAELKKSLNTIVDENEEVAQAARDQEEDGVQAEDGMLRSIAKVFYINIHIYNDEADNICRSYANEGAAGAYLLHTPGHWNYMICANQTDGLASVLSYASVSSATARSISIEAILAARNSGYQAAFQDFDKKLDHTLFGKVKNIQDLERIVNTLEGEQQDEAKGLLAAIDAQNQEIEENYRSVNKK